MLKKILLIIGVLGIFIGLCLVNALCINTCQITAKENIIETNKLKDDSNELLIAYFSDLHYGNYIDNEFLNNVTKKINDFRPDIIIFGGDLIDSYASKGISEIGKENIINAFDSLDAKYGKYAVFGEDDINSDGTFDSVANILSQAGFKIINNDVANINVGKGNFIDIVGINSLSYGESISSLFADTSNYTFVVSHYPDVFSSILDYDFDYMISGHSHGGQVYLPIISLFNRKQGCLDYYRGNYSKNNRSLQVSNGVGRTGIDARLLADAQINLFRIEPSKNIVIQQEES